MAENDGDHESVLEGLSATVNTEHEPGAGRRAAAGMLAERETARTDVTSGPAILSDEEAERQRMLLLRLRVALGGLGIEAVLARNHHLGLPTEYVRVSGVCGLKPPSLHVFAGLLGMVRVQVSDGSFALATGQSFPAEDAEKAAYEIRRLAGPGLSNAGSSLRVAADRAEA
jgi:hypothetical protein